MYHWETKCTCFWGRGSDLRIILPWKYRMGAFYFHVSLCLPSNFPNRFLLWDLRLKVKWVSCYLFSNKPGNVWSTVADRGVSLWWGGRGYYRRIGLGKGRFFILNKGKGFFKKSFFNSPYCGRCFPFCQSLLILSKWVMHRQFRAARHKQNTQIKKNSR